MGQSNCSVPVVVVGGTSSGVGKTTIAVGLMLALRERGLTVQAFKVGPDFIDPLHHEAATGRPSINLDGWMLSQEQVVQAFHRATADADIAVVEGVMGLFDGRDGTSDQGSTAQVAKWLGAPVLLVLDCSAIARSAAAVVKGYQDFDNGLRLGGLLFNKVGGKAHTQWLKDAIASAGLSVEVLGGIPQDESVHIPERHLGLFLPGEKPYNGKQQQHPDGDKQQQVEGSGLTRLCRQHVDLEALIQLAGTAQVPPRAQPHLELVATPVGAEAGLATLGKDDPLAAAAALSLLCPAPRIAVARDEAFCFYYQENLALLQEAGAELVFFSPMHDPLPSGISGVYLGGGYPENHADELADNLAARVALAAFAAAGGVVYAECGGLMYLSKSLQPPGEPTDLPMVGVFPFKTVMGKMTMAYVEVGTTADCPLFPAGLTAKGHAHHHSQIVEELVVGGVAQWSGKGGKEGQERGWATGYLAQPQVPGASEVPEGFCTRNVLASYIHLHFGSCPQLATALVAKCAEVDLPAVDAAIASAVADALLATQLPVPAAAGLVSAPSLGGYACAEGGSSYGKAEGSPLQLRPGHSPGLPPVRSSPNLGTSASRGQSLDHHYHPHHHQQLHQQHTQQFLLQQHHYQQQQELKGGLYEAGSPVRYSSSAEQGLLAGSLHSGLAHRRNSTPVGRLSSLAAGLPHAISSGSLSNFTTGTHHTDPHALHAGDPSMASPLSSSSPSSSSPREPTGSPVPPVSLPLLEQHMSPGPFALGGHQPAPPWPEPPPPGLAPAPHQPPLPPHGHGQHLAAAAAPAYGGPSSSQAGGHPALTHSHSWSLPHGYSAAGAVSGAAAAGQSVCDFTAWRQLQEHPLAPAMSTAASIPQTYHLLQPGSRMPSLHPAASLAFSQPAPPHPALNQAQQAQHHLPPSRVRSLAVGMGSKRSSFSSLDLGYGSTAALAAAAAASGGNTLVLQPQPSLAAAAAAAAPYAWQQPAHPPSEKIASLSPGATEVLWALGLGGRVAAVNEGCDWPLEAQMKPKVLRRAVSTSGAGGSGSGGQQPGVGRSSSTDSLTSYPHQNNHLSSEGPQQRHRRSNSGLEGPPATALGPRAAAAAPGWVVDEQVLARERPGLIVYEEDDSEGSLFEQQQPCLGLCRQPTAGGGGTAVGALPLGRPAGHAGPAMAAAGLGLEREPSLCSGAPRGCGGPGAALGAAEDSAGSLSSGSGAAGSNSAGCVGRVGQAVLEALVAVGLQHSCCVVCIRRRTLAEVLESMLAVGEAAGVGQEAARTVARLRSRLRRAAGQGALAVQVTGACRPRVLLLRSAVPICTVGWWASDLVVLAGGENAVEQAGDPPTHLSWEQVQAFAPEVLVVASLLPAANALAVAHSAATGGANGAAEAAVGCRALSDLSELAARPGWWQLPAVKEGRVFVADHALLCRPGPRLVEGVEALARMIHEDDVELLCPDKAVLKLSLRPGQRCRHRVLPNYFMPYE